jgi:hypothetical protein
MKKRFHIGIDPGAHTGYSVFDTTERRLTHCLTTDFWNVFVQVGLIDPSDCTVYVEDASLINYSFRRQGGIEYQDRLSRNVGRIQRECELLIVGLIRLGYEVKRVKPSGQKWDVKTFRAYTKWEGRTSGHARDAARLVFGM